MRLMVLALVLVLSVSGCIAASAAKQFCLADSDCICGGGDKDTGQCYLGNKIYHKLNVNESFVCADFCGGIGGNLEAKCVDYQCKQVLRK